MKAGKLTSDAEKRKKLRRKKKIRNALIALAFIMVSGAAFLYSTSKPREYRVVAVSRGGIEETVEASGEIISKKWKTYYAEFTAPVVELNVETGKAFEQGDLLAEFDTSDLELSASQSELARIAAQGRASALSEQNSKNAQIYAGAGTSITILDQQIADQIENIRSIQEKLGMAEQKASDIATLTNRVNMEMDTDKKEDLQKTLDGWKADYNSYDVPFLSGELVSQQTVLSDLMGSRSEYEAWQKSADASLVTSGNKQAAVADSNAAAMTKEELDETLQKAAAGLLADFNGIITGCFVEQGATVTEGMPLFKLESSDELTAKVMISKYDIGKMKEGQTGRITIAGTDYEGSVTAISRIATTDGAEKSKIAVEVALNQPDPSVYIGMEADVAITTGKNENALILPVEAIYIDDTGSYCYVIEEGIVARKDIQTGFENATQIEVTQGLEEGQIVILDAVAEAMIGQRAITKAGDTQ